MKTIQTLVSDIYATVEKDGWFTNELSEDFSRELGLRLVESTAARSSVPTLRLSKMGPICEKQLWHSIHTPSLEERIEPWARIKFTYGHILETLAISMAKSAGHTVTGEQDAVSVDGIVGHRDCVIDGCIVDVKSTTSLSFKKFKDKTLAENDSFGYLDQLDGYLVGSSADPLVTVRDRAYILAIDKQLGHICLYEHFLREQHIRNRIRSYKEIVALDKPPACTCETVPEGKSGNVKLGVKASYSGYKHVCFPRLRTFLYARGPVYLTHVAREPKDVPEINKAGVIVLSGQSQRSVYPPAGAYEPFEE